MVNGEFYDFSISSAAHCSVKNAATPSAFRYVGSVRQIYSIGAAVRLRRNGEAGEAGKNKHFLNRRTKKL